MNAYAWFKSQSDQNYTNARNAKTHALTKAYLADAERWDRRAGLLTLEDGCKLVEDTILWREIEKVDTFARKGMIV